MTRFILSIFLVIVVTIVTIVIIAIIIVIFDAGVGTRGRMFSWV